MTANAIKAVIAGKNQTIGLLAKDLNKEADDLREFNDMEDGEMALIEGKVYYLYEKYSDNGNADYHITEPGESLWDISQRYAIELRQIGKRNRMSVSETPQVGRVIYLNTKRSKRTPIEIKPKDQIPVSSTPDDKQNANVKSDDGKNGLFDLVKDPRVLDTANYYAVKPGENIFTVSQQTGLSLDDLQKYNTDIDFTKELEAGRAVRKTPPTDAKNNTQPYPGLDEPHKGRRAHVVMPGESPTIIAAKYNVSEQDIYIWNGLAPQDVMPGMSLFVEAPLDQQNAMNGANRPPFKMPTAQEMQDAEDNGQYIFLPGDTEAAIAQKYNVKADDLRQWNNLCHDEQPLPGDRLYVNMFAVPVDHIKPCPDKPTKTVSDVPVKRGQQMTSSQSGQSNAFQTSMPLPKDASNTQWPKYHTVASGDGLWSISKKYGASVDQIRDWNALPDSQINKGQRLIVGYVVSPLSQAPSGQVAKFHKIKKGETVWRISKNNGLDLNKFRQMNGMQNDHIIQGQRIFVGYEPGLPQYHQTGPGETVESIAKRFMLLPSFIRTANGMTASEQPTAGQKLRLK